MRKLISVITGLGVFFSPINSALKAQTNVNNPTFSFVNSPNSQSSFAVAGSAPTLDANQQAALQNALSQATFNNSPATTSGASYTANPAIPQIPSFSYVAGTPLAQALPAGIVGLFGTNNNYSPQSATQAAGGNVTALATGNADKLPFLSKIPLAATIAANPTLADRQVADVFPAWGAADPNATLGATASSPLGKLPIPTEVLATTPVSNLLGITNTPYSNYPGIGKPDLPSLPSDGAAKIADLPGMGDLPLSQLVKIGDIPAGLQLMKFDKLNSGQNKISVPTGSKIASGSNKEPNAPCTGICDAVELLNTVAPKNNSDPLNGSLSIISQQLKGGYGLLGDLMTAAGVREPAGFEVPYIGINGCGSKWSAESPNAQGGTIRQQLNLRFCSQGLLGFQATPYFIRLPLPLPTSEKQANVLLPMSVKPVIIAKSIAAAVPASPSATVAALPTVNGKQPSFTTPSNDVNQVALFGSATKKSYSPLLGVTTNDA